MTALPFCMDALIVARRWAGSSMCVARLASTAETALPPTASSAVRRLTGTIAIKGFSGNAFWSVRYARRAPAHVADDVVDGGAGGVLDVFDALQRP